MYWGNSLLGIEETFKSAVYAIKQWFLGFFYMIWRILATIVEGVEGIFRNLAGIGSTGDDMVDKIIRSDQVKTIFGNLVGFSMAVIVFFTIVKIIQDHYKEKDGGNPYKIVIRTFKGLLMFFFVEAAVVVGLKASEVMFKALDAATGTGSASISGLVFKNMASGANLASLGQEEDSIFADEQNKYYSRVANENYNQGHYFMTEVADEGKSFDASSLAAKYYDAFPALRYGIVRGDGDKETVSPLSNWLNVADLGDDVSDTWNNNMNPYRGGKAQLKGSTGGVSGSAGFQSDLLRGVDLIVTPGIDLAWSPVDIDVYSYVLKNFDHKEHDIFTSVMGNGTQIPSSTQFLKFDTSATPKTKSLEESAKQFGITIHGKVALQSGSANVGFNIDSFDQTKFEMVLKAVTLNVVYTNVLQKVIQIFPKFPGETSVGPLVINYVQFISPIIFGVFKDLAENAFANYIPKNEKGEPAVEVMSLGATSYNSGIWSIFNTKSRFLDTVIEQYRIDANFTDLWGQLTKNFDQWIKMLEKDAATAYEKAEQRADGIDKIQERIGEQEGWQNYMGKVNKYNTTAASLLTTLGNLLDLWELAPDNDRQDYLNAHNYSGTFDKLEDDIKNTFTQLVGNYNGLVYHQKPTSNYADPRFTPSVYLPIVEFNLTDNAAKSLSVAQIKSAMVNDAGSTGRTGKVTANLLIDENNSDSSSAYRLVDWSAYGPQFKSKLNGIGDLYYEGVTPGDEVLVNSSKNKLAFMNVARTNSDNWNEQGGIRYFLQDTSNKNSFYQHSAANGALLDYLIVPNSYWSTEGINKDGEIIWYYYEGTTERPITDWYNEITNGLGTAQVEISPSLANSNQTMSTGAEELTQSLNNLLNMDTTTPEANKFADEIVRIRKLNTQDGENDDDVRIMKDWIQQKNSVKPNGNHSEMMLYEMAAIDPGLIDDYMASSTSNTRRYLILSTDKASKSAIMEGRQWQNYIGQFSWRDQNTVSALYDFWHMNFAVGFICIISALGVYLNFAFGLIQRAVNMAVLYVMSPVTIAFYPFDDGNRFNNSFVKPFYQEAISAFAVIISLNLFVVLMTPLQNAANAVTGSAHIMGWLALVAFVSMLPKIRDSITSILGAGKLSEKSLTDTFKSFRSSMVPSDLKNAAASAKKTKEGAVKRLNKLQADIAAHNVNKANNRNNEIARLQGMSNRNWVQQHRLDRLTGASAERKQAQKAEREAKRVESQKRIDEARNRLNGGASKIDATSGLSFSEKIRLDRQNKAAKARARGYVKRKIGESDFDYENRVDAQANEYLKDNNFKRSVNGLIAAKAAGVNGWATRNAEAIKNSKLVVGTGNWLKTQAADAAMLGGSIAGAAGDVGSFGRAIGNSIGNTFIGEGIKRKFGIDGELAKDEKSAVGLWWRYHDKAKWNELENQALAKTRRRQEIEGKERQDAYEGLVVNEAESKKANERLLQGGRLQAAYEAVQNETDIKKKLLDLQTAENVKNGMSSTKAYSEAQKAVGALKDQTAIADQYAALGGDDAYAQGLAKGYKELTISLNQDKVKAYTASLRAKAKQGSARIDNELRDAENQRRGYVEQCAKAIAEDLGVDGDDNKMKALTNIIANSNSNTLVNDVIGEINGRLGLKNKKLVTDALNKRAQLFNQAKQTDAVSQGLLAAKDAAKSFKTGQDKINSKIGNLVDIEARNALTEDFINLNDNDLNSINPDSLGAAKRRIIDEEFGGNADDKECQARLRATEVEFANRLTERFNQFMAQNSNKIREHSLQKKAREELRNSQSTQVANALIEMRSKITSEDMDPSSLEAIIRDGLIQDLHAQNKYDLAGTIMKQLVKGVREHDDELLKNLMSQGVSQATVDKFKQWEAEGNEKRLQGVYTLGTFDESHMGVISEMGGSSLQGAEAAVAQITRIKETQELMEKYKIAIRQAGEQESHERAVIDHTLETMENLFAGTEWKSLMNRITNADGKAVESHADLINTLRQNLKDAANGRDNSAIQTNLSALAEIKDAMKDNKAAVDEITSLQNAFASCKVAERKSTEVRNLQDQISRMDAEIREQAKNVLKEFTEAK